MFSVVSVLGISGKSQILFAIVYISRYLDLFTTYVSLYNTFMKVVFIGSSLGTLYLMYLKFRATYDHNHDSFRIEFLIIPCLILALLINHDFTVMEVSLLFVIYDVTVTLPIIILIFFLGIMDILNLLGIGCNSTTTVFGQQNGRSRKYYEPLSICIRFISCTLHSKLGKIYLLQYLLLIQLNYVH